MAPACLMIKLPALASCRCLKWNGRKLVQSPDRSAIVSVLLLASFSLSIIVSGSTQAFSKACLADVISLKASEALGGHACSCMSEKPRGSCVQGFGMRHYNAAGSHNLQVKSTCN